MRHEPLMAACHTAPEDAAERPVSDADFQVHKPIGACGCLSALATYTSSVDNNGVRQTVLEGIAAIKGGGAKALILATEPALIAGKEVHVGLTCARPS
ncbi:hypothetical protein GCM10010994_01420 [Chelatococcus reniformis]|uniref:Uncharacterized protein n=2 Tax=Chelatococcus reniformis TaxID=1494448 RepID=A0A916TWG4_9HYPH|nr:hypothetical protein GCM10010994_01420 [Chelatococcus reniformis]